MCQNSEDKTSRGARCGQRKEIMKYSAVAVMLLACVLAACNASVPSRMTVSDPKKRRVDTEPGTVIEGEVGTVTVVVAV